MIAVGGNSLLERGEVPLALVAVPGTSRGGDGCPVEDRDPRVGRGHRTIMAVRWLHRGPAGPPNGLDDEP